MYNCTITKQWDFRLVSKLFSINYLVKLIMELESKLLFILLEKKNTGNVFVFTIIECLFTKLIFKCKYLYSLKEQAHCN